MSSMETPILLLINFKKNIDIFLVILRKFFDQNIPHGFHFHYYFFFVLFFSKKKMMKKGK